TPRIKQLILKGRQDEILTAITEAGIHSGMQTFGSALLNLYKNKIITREEALNSSTTPNDLAILLEQASEASAQRGMREIGLKNLD
ncbi:MAG: type IV pili twitching motility protein PilT, partial [Campylobacter sp.]|nr:type IV pili twitching motility protein PilT [Campylobacter sp.]